MNQKSYRDILDSAAADSLSQNTDLWPGIVAELEIKSFLMTLRTRPLLAILLALLTLLALTGAAYAIGKSLGYIPGIGLVDTSSALRVLAEPVSQTRDGITITVEEAVLSSDKTVLVFTVENIPFDKLSHQVDPRCYIFEELKLPDGSLLEITGGGQQGGGVWVSGYRHGYTFEPVPADVNEATLLIPCILGTLPGALPKNWEFPLRFAPAPADMTALPVIEYTPSPEPSGGTAETNPIAITNVIDLEDSYILIGEFAPPIPTGFGTSIIPQLNLMSLTDGNGQDVNWEYPQDIDQPELSSDKPFVETWSLQVAKGFTPPLNIKYSSRYSYPVSPGAPFEFEFDAGENPQPGDKWQIDKTFNVDGIVFTLTTIEAVIGPPCNPASAFIFTFTSPDAIIDAASTDTALSNVTADSIDGYVPVPLGCPGPGGGGADAGETWASSLGFAEMPKGKLKVKLSVELYSGPREWILHWQPEDLSSNSAVLTDAPQACLTLDSWKTAMENPRPIPSNLTGKLIVYGRILENGKNPSLDNFGISTINLDGSNKQGIGQGNAPSLSPDGTQAVFDDWDGGIFLVDIASGEKLQIPNTTADDSGPRWSPDGKQIAFMHNKVFQKGIISLSIINPDGTGLQRVSKEFIGLLIGWTSDGMGLFYGEVTKEGMLLKKLDIASGAASDLFAIHNLYSNRDYDVTFDISSDGNKLTFFDQVSGNTLDGLYVSKIDGSDRKLISFQSQPWAFTPIWSPDGKWLMTYGWDNSPDNLGMYALVNVLDCRITPLPWLDDTERVWEWIP